MLPGFTSERSLYRSRQCYVSNGLNAAIGDGGGAVPAASRSSNCVQTGPNSWTCSFPGWSAPLLFGAMGAAAGGLIGGVVGGLVGLYCWIFGCG